MPEWTVTLSESNKNPRLTKRKPPEIGGESLCICRVICQADRANMVLQKAIFHLLARTVCSVSGIELVFISLQNVRAMARRGQAPNFIRRLPRRRHLRLVLPLIYSSMLVTSTSIPPSFLANAL